MFIVSKERDKRLFMFVSFWPKLPRSMHSNGNSARHRLVHHHLSHHQNNALSSSYLRLFCRRLLRSLAECSNLFFLRLVGHWDTL